MKGGEKMDAETKKISKAQQKAVNKYISNNYDRINLTVPKGRKKDIEAHAAQMGESTNAFVKRAIDETMEADGHIMKPAAASSE